MGKANQELSEYLEQVNIFAWRNIESVKYPELRLLTASANGVKLSIGLAMKARRAGMLPKGYPDLFMPVKRGEYSGLFIELKKKGGRKPKPEQADWLMALSEQGYACYCCKGSQAAIKIIEDYLLGRIKKNGSRSEVTPHDSREEVPK